MNMQAGYNPFADGLNSGDQSFGARKPYLLDGDYNLEVMKCVVRGRQDPNYIIEVKVLESNVPERPPGTECVIFIDIGNRDTRGKHICGFIASVYGVEPTTLPKDSTTTPWDNQPWMGYANWSISEQNPFAAKRFFCNVQTIFQAKDPSKTFTLHSYSPFGSKQIGQRMVGPAFGAQQQQAGGAPAGGAPAGVMPGAMPGAMPGGFQAPPPQPNMAPQGFGTPMPGQGAPQGGFAPPGGGQMPQGAPPAGWGQQAAPAPAPGFQQPAQPQGGFGFQQPMPAQPQGFPQQGPWGGGQR